MCSRCRCLRIFHEFILQYPSSCSRSTDYQRRTGQTHKKQLHAVPKGAGNNGWALKHERGGVPVVQIAIPLRYMHSPVEVADLRDVESVISLTAAGVLGLGDDFPLLPEQP